MFVSHCNNQFFFREMCIFQKLKFINYRQVSMLSVGVIARIVANGSNGDAEQLEPVLQVCVCVNALLMFFDC